MSRRVRIRRESVAANAALLAEAKVQEAYLKGAEDTDRYNLSMPPPVVYKEVASGGGSTHFDVYEDYTTLSYVFTMATDYTPDTGRADRLVHRASLDKYAIGDDVEAGQRRAAYLLASLVRNASLVTPMYRAVKAIADATGPDHILDIPEGLRDIPLFVNNDSLIRALYEELNIEKDLYGQLHMG